MKQGGPLKRTAGLKKTGALKRTGSPAKGTRRKTDSVRAGDFYRRVTLSPIGAPFPCMVCERVLDRNEAEAHHCVEKAWILSELRGYDWEAQEIWRWDYRNGVALCKDCHAKHTGGDRIPREWLPQAVWDFAADLDELIGTQGAEVHLARKYPLKLRDPDEDS